MPRIRTHPGEILREEYLAPLKMSARELAGAIGVTSQPHLRDRARAPRCDRRHGTPPWALLQPRFWLNTQVAHDLSKAKSEVDLSTIPNRAT